MAISDIVGRFIQGLSDPAVSNTGLGIKPTPEQVASSVNASDMMMLGVNPTKENAPRTRQEIYTKLQRMAKFAPLAEALNIHIAVALGGDAFNNKVVFIKPASRLRKDEEKLSKFEKDQLDKLHKRIPRLEKLINRNIFKICHDAITYGDAFVRPYVQKGSGILEMICDETTLAPYVLPFEVGNKTVAYRLLVSDSSNSLPLGRNTLKCSQMQRLKMQRVTTVNQQTYIDQSMYIRSLEEDDLDKVVPVPAKVGGSFLLPVEDIFDNVVTCLAGMTTQQIADSVKRVMYSIDQEGTTPLQRRMWQSWLTKFLDDNNEYTKEAFAKGEAMWKPQVGIFPQMGSKQAVTLMGDLTGERRPINTEVFMINVRLLMGGMGSDPSQVGWLDMLTGGLGNGGAISASVQQMLRSQRIRTDTTEFLDQILALDWLYAYGESFTDELDFPWEIEFYSDQTASMTEQVNNQNQRANSGIVICQLAQIIKDLGVSTEVAIKLLERYASLDYEEAKALAESIAKEEQAQPTDNDIE